jgi:hypothetical protein
VPREAVRGPARPAGGNCYRCPTPFFPSWLVDGALVVAAEVGLAALIYAIAAFTGLA